MQPLELEELDDDVDEDALDALDDEVLDTPLVPLLLVLDWASIGAGAPRTSTAS